MIVNVDAKSCTRCKTIKYYTEFGKNKVKPDGYNSQCRQCYHDAYILRTPNSKRYTMFGGTKQEYNKLYHKNHYENNKSYYRNKCAIRERNLQQATPSWGNRFFIEEAYALAKLRSECTNILWEVDHVVPVKSKTVCGLHVEHNLQVVPAQWNRAKQNKWDCEKGVVTWLS